MIQISILVDNTAGGKFGAEHGLSYLIEVNAKKYLFDAGYSDLFLQNAEKLGISVHENVETVVLSHGHWDHGNGLKHLNNKKLIAHPDVFSKRLRKRDRSTVGINLTETEVQQKFDILSTKTPFEIAEKFWFLGEIPRLNNFESRQTTFVFEDGSDDFVNDDSALALVANNELVVVTGCSHSGICNICEYAKQVTGVDKIKAVIGGFHLKTANEQTLKTIEYFKANKVETVLPSHCTDLPALALFQQEFNSVQLKTGQQLTF